MKFTLQFDGERRSSGRRHRRLGALPRRAGASSRRSFKYHRPRGSALRGGQLPQLPDECGWHAERSHLHHAGARGNASARTRTPIPRSRTTGWRGCSSWTG